ncbi:DUF4942 domain-containing protein [Serratia nevei]|uniref:DUF4942 domain-containing protein n=1 Tax=Serratia nevei TaxID=2703794 RepID=UPI00254FB4DE|nr:DUF4942 domain-containing protein [Serratia nevei]MDK5165561.1 DUF4942 domain-containing protein [Serratia nevei]
MELIVSTDIDALVARRDAIFRELDEAEAAFGRAKKLFEGCPDIASFEYYDGKRVQTPFESLPKIRQIEYSESMEELKQSFDAEAWEYLMDASGVGAAMSASARSEWEKQIKARKTPPLTKENIVATFKDLFVRKDEMFEDGVIEAFRSCSWDHKSNLPVKFGKKVIFTHFYGDSHLHKVDDLRRVLHVFDGKPQPDQRTGVWATLYRRGSDGLFEDEYVSVVRFKNGNVHCKFKKPELTEKLNGILARRFPNALAAPK